MMVMVVVIVVVVIMMTMMMVVMVMKPTYLDLHCLLRQGMSCLAREGLKYLFFFLTKVVQTDFVRNAERKNIC